MRPPPTPLGRREPLLSPWPGWEVRPASRPQPRGDACGQTLGDDGTVGGSWAASCQSQVQGRGYARYYTFTLGEESQITIDLISSVDPYLFLRQGDSRSGAVLHENDDIENGVNLNSRITGTLAAGSYTIEATTFATGQSGTFTLTVVGLGGTTGQPPATVSIARVISPVVATNISPPLGVGELDFYQVMAARSITSSFAHEFPVGRQFFSVAGPLNDHLEAGVGQAVQRAVSQYRVVEEAEPFFHGPVAGDYEAGDPVPADDQLVQIGRLLGGELVQAQVVQDEQVRGEEGPEGPVPGSCRLWPGPWP